MSVGENIRDIRKSKKMSQEELGKLLGVSQAMIAQYETGTRIPKIETLARIAEALNVFIGELDHNWGTDILNNNEEYQKTRKMLSNLEATAERKVKREEKFLLDAYWKLNSSGRAEARKRVQELTEIPRYANSDKPVQIVAAHNPEVPEETPEDSDGSKGTDN